MCIGVPENKEDIIGKLFVAGTIAFDDKTATSVVDDLKVRTFALNDNSGTGTAVFAVVDSYGLALGDVREIARVRLNGRDLGVKFMPPYDFAIPTGVLGEKGNVLEVEVTNLGANRLRWNDLNGVDWKYFSDINMVGMDYKKLDASKWKPLPSGLLTPVWVMATMP